MVYYVQVYDLEELWAFFLHTGFSFSLHEGRIMKRKYLLKLTIDKSNMRIFVCIVSFKSKNKLPLFDINKPF